MALDDDAADRLAQAQAERIRQQAAAAFERMLQAIRNGTPPRDAINAQQRAFSGEFTTELAQAFSTMLQRAVGVRDVRDMSIGGLRLADRLYRENQVTTSHALAVIQDHAKGVQQARELALRLYDGYDPADGIRRPLEGRARADLPLALRVLTGDARSRVPLTQLMDEGQRQASRLKSPALRAAYLQTFKAWEQGAGAAQLERRLEVATREKNRYLASRIARTELARAHQHQVASDIMADDTIEVVQVMLNPLHPSPDICDLHARADLWGLGPGLYPKAEAPRTPFHPHCFCKLRARPSMTAAAAKRVEGGEAAFLRGLPVSEAARVIGSRAKLEAALRGVSTDTIINANVDPLYHLRRLRDLDGAPEPVPAPPAPQPEPAPRPAAPETVEQFIAAGRTVLAELPAVDTLASVHDWHAQLMLRLTTAGRTGGAASIMSNSAGAKLVRHAAAFYPSTWVDTANDAGELFAMALRDSRGHALTIGPNTAEGMYRLKDFGLRYVKPGQGYIAVPTGGLATAIHEYAHRLQSTVPGLDALFQRLHRDRVASELLERLDVLQPGYGYGPDELTRPDGYADPYQGREYKVARDAAGRLQATPGGALEVMTMAFQAVLGAVAPRSERDTGTSSRALLREMLETDREMVELTLGLLFHFNPRKP